MVALCLALAGQAAAPGGARAEESAFPAPPAAATSATTATTATALRAVSGLVMLDYNRLRLSGGGDFDLFGIHYLHGINDWLYAGIGASAPLVEGSYGGFFAADLTLHAQRRLRGNWFVNGGLSLGAGAGGASVAHIRSLSGDGLYGRAYAGIGYAGRRFSFGVNYARVAIAGSQIDASTLSLFVQRPLGFSVGAYADAGARLAAQTPGLPARENMLTFLAQNLTQIDPRGSYRGDIGLASAQFSHFHDRRFYSFLSVDIGVSGLLWYNQIQGGLGARWTLSSHLNLYGQIGLGSGGWVTDTIDTGPGFVLYPKVMLEYLWDNGVGAALSAGYLHAPFGSARSWSLGLGLSYHLTPGQDGAGAPGAGADYRLRGVRLHLFDRVSTRVDYNGRRSEPLNLLAVQADYALGEHWYAAAQIAAATGAFRDYAGYVEAFLGLGWQSRPVANGRLQGYAQLLYGLNDVGIDTAHDVGALLYPSLGVSYRLSDRLSLYGQLGTTLSLGRYLDSGMTNFFETHSLGFGLTYRFSLPTRS